MHGNIIKVYYTL